MVRALWVLAGVLGICASSAAFADGPGRPSDALPAADAPVVAPADVPVASPPLPTPTPTPPARADLPPRPPCAPASGVCACWEPCACPPCRRIGVEFEGHVSWVSPLEGPVSEDSGRADQATWDALEREPELGFRAALNIPLPWCCAWLTPAGTYWGCLRESGSQLGTLAVRATPDAPLVVSPLQDISTATDSTLWDLDLGVWRDARCRGCARLGWGLGLKYVSLDEQAGFSFVANNSLALIEGDVENDLFAVQASAHAGVRRGSFDLSGQIGVFGGWLHETARIDRSTFGGVPGASASADGFAWGAEATLQVRCYLGRSVYLSTGVEGMVLVDFARGERVLDFTQVGSGTIPARLDEGTVFAVRAFLGIGFDL